MKYTKYFIFFFIIFSSCKRTEKDYKMISYESKAWVDTIDFPTIKMFSDNTFFIYENNRLITKGMFSQSGDSLKFEVNGNGYNATIRGCFTDRLKTIIRIHNLTGIGVEVKYGYFKSLKSD